MCRIFGTILTMDLGKQMHLYLSLLPQRTISCIDDWFRLCQASRKSERTNLQLPFDCCCTSVVCTVPIVLPGSLRSGSRRRICGRLPPLDGQLGAYLRIIYDSVPPRTPGPWKQPHPTMGMAEKCKKLLRRLF